MFCVVEVPNNMQTAFAAGPRALRELQKESCSRRFKRGQGKVTLPSRGNRLAIKCKALVANGCERRGAGGRGCAGGGYFAVQDASLVNTKLARSGCRNTAEGYRRSGAHEGRRRGACNLKIEATLLLATENTVDEERVHHLSHTSVIAVAGG